MHEPDAGTALPRTDQLKPSISIYRSSQHLNPAGFRAPQLHEKAPFYEGPKERLVFTEDVWPKGWAGPVWLKGPTI